MQKSTQRWLYSIGGVVAVFVALVAVNFILGVTPVRVDLTEGKLYTLSDGTRKALAKLEAPVRVRFYFNQGADYVPVPIRAFAGRVEDLLNELRSAANGKLVIEKLNPQPDSDAEDSANLDGIEPQETPSGEKFYLGLTVSFADRKLAIPVLAPNRERLLEYDLVKTIGRATKTTRPVVGVMTALPLFGMPPNPMMGGAPAEPQIIIGELRRDFDVKRVGMDVERIDDEIKTLLVVHPRGISDQAQFALDQFVLRGGKLVVFLDPYAYFDQMPGPFAGMGGSASNLDKLLKAWGYEFEAAKVVLDMKYMAGSGPRAVPTVIQLDADAMSRDDVTTSHLGTTLLAFAGVFSGKPAEGLSAEVLMHTSPIVKLVDSGNAMARGEEAVRGFQPDGKEYPIALKLTGKFKTAFPDGKPAVKDARGGASKAPDAKAKDAAADPGPVLKESQSETTVVLVGDTDLLNDGAAVQISEIFGQRVAIPINGNLAFGQGLVEQLAGDADLVGLRSRATAQRPFTVVKQMEAEAAQAYLGKIQSLEDSLQDTRKKLESLQRTKTPAGGAAILTAEQQAEIDSFRKRAAETRRELKDVRRELRSETEALEFWTKVINIGAMSLVVAIAGLAIAFVKRRRRGAR
ncbi:MAG TPA: GldG family protein [Burkholderiales bacterium]|nr:GldG family protein [Burkholderiales bacterium]